MLAVLVGTASAEKQRFFCVLHSDIYFFYSLSLISAAWFVINSAANSGHGALGQGERFESFAATIYSGHGGLRKGVLSFLHTGLFLTN